MPSSEIGVVPPLMQFSPDRATARWSVIREMALEAEGIGFDGIWPSDRPRLITVSFPVGNIL